MFLKQAKFENIPETSQIRDLKNIDESMETVKIIGNVKDYSPLYNFPNIRHLLISEANQQQLNQFSRMTWLESLEIHWLRGVTDLSPIGNLHNLRILTLEGNLKDISIEPLQNLINLHVLSIAAPLSTAINGGAIYFENLSPLSSLTNLEYLELFGVRTRELGLRPLGHLKSLKELLIDNVFSLEDYAYLAAALPNTKGIFQIPYHQTTLDFRPCKKCGRINYYVLNGKKRNVFICTSCEKEKLTKHLELFEKLKQEFSLEL